MMQLEGLGTEDLGELLQKETLVLIFGFVCRTVGHVGDAVVMVDLPEQYQQIACGVVIGRPAGVQEIIGGGIVKSDRLDPLLLFHFGPERCLLNNVAAGYLFGFLWLDFTIHALVFSDRLQS
jgi:hypothetical protein